MACVGARLGQRASKSACFVVPPLFRADSGTNLIKQGENVKGRPCGSVAQLAECSHGKREALGSRPGRATIFSSPVKYRCANYKPKGKYLSHGNVRTYNGKIAVHPNYHLIE